MHILPPPLCGLYSICAQNGYGQRPCKIVLLTLVTPREVTDLYLSWGINTEHARTAYHKTCGTEYQQPYRRRNPQTPYFNWNIAQARPMQLAKLTCKVEFQPPIGRTHSWRFSIFINIWKIRYTNMRSNLFQMRYNLNQWASTHVDNLLKRNIWQFAWILQLWVAAGREKLSMGGANDGSEYGASWPQTIMLECGIMMTYQRICAIILMCFTVWKRRITRHHTILSST